MITAYCVKCKERGVIMSNPAIHKTKKGGYMAKGSCPSCTITLCAIMSEDRANIALANGIEKAF